MAHVVEKNDVRALTDEAWLRDARSSFDAGAALTSALTPAWSVERETDPWGELSIVMLPAADTAAQQSFILYEENGSVQVSTFLSEGWQCRQTFQTCQRAVAAIIQTASLPVHNASRTTTRAKSSAR